MALSPVDYAGQCSICGWQGTFSIADQQQPVDRDLRCGQNHNLRYRDQAHVLIDEFGDGRQLSLDELVPSPLFGSRRVYHVGYTGPIRQRLRVLEGYVESAYDPTQPPGVVLAEGRVNQDLQRLSFDDSSFDLVLSSHVMEHVPDPWLSFAEMYRVLRPGGRMIASIPTIFPLRAVSRRRAEIVGGEGEVVHHKKARYHKSPEGQPALVFTDFGADLHDRLTGIGFDVRMRRPNLQIQGAVRDLVVVGYRHDNEVGDGR